MLTSVVVNLRAKRASTLSYGRVRTKTAPDPSRVQYYRIMTKIVTKKNAHLMICHFKFIIPLDKVVNWVNVLNRHPHEMSQLLIFGFTTFLIL